MNIKNLGKFLGIFFLFLLSDLFYLIPLEMANIEIASLSYQMQIGLVLLSEFILMIILFLIYRKYLIEKWQDFKNNKNKYLNIGLRVWLIGLGIMCACNALIAILSPVKEALNESQVQELIETAPFLSLILTTIFAPFNEELIFRKSIQDFIKNKWFFIIVSGLIFGYLHVSSGESIFDFIYIIPYGALGASFAYALTKTDNIYTTIFMHLIHNGILTLIAIFL